MRVAQVSSDYRSEGFSAAVTPAVSGVIMVARKAHQDRKAKQVEKKSKDLKHDLKKMTCKATGKTEAQTMSSISAWLEQHPRATAHLWQSITMGAYDHLDNPGMEDEVNERLPSYMNKYRLLSKEISTRLITKLRPEWQQWLQKVGSKETKKEDLAEVLAFLLHVEPTSALPSKKVAALDEFAASRWEKCGRRCEKWTPTDKTTLEDQGSQQGFFHFT